MVLGIGISIRELLIIFVMGESFITCFFIRIFLKAISIFLKIVTLKERAAHQNYIGSVINKSAMYIPRFLKMVPLKELSLYQN